MEDLSYRTRSQNTPRMEKSDDDMEQNTSNDLGSESKDSSINNEGLAEDEEWFTDGQGKKVKRKKAAGAAAEGNTTKEGKEVQDSQHDELPPKLKGKKDSETEEIDNL